MVRKLIVNIARVLPTHLLDNGWTVARHWPGIGHVLPTHSLCMSAAGAKKGYASAMLFSCHPIFHILETSTIFCIHPEGTEEKRRRRTRSDFQFHTLRKGRCSGRRSAKAVELPIREVKMILPICKTAFNTF